jgi:hypothetical protein
VTDLMAALGLSQYCVDIRTFDPDRLADAFASLVDHTREVKISMAASLAAYRAQAGAQFDLLFPPASEKMRPASVAPPHNSAVVGATPK